MEISNAEYFMRLIDKYCLSQIFVFLHPTMTHTLQGYLAGGAATGLSPGQLSVKGQSKSPAFFSVF